MENNLQAEKVAKIDIGKGFQVKIGTQFVLELEGIEGAKSCVFVGNRADKYIVVTPPADFESIRDMIAKGGKAAIRYISQGKILEFNSSVIEILEDPVDLLLLALPEFVNKRDLRSQKRINCFISAKIEVATENNDALNGVIKDISKSGCRLLIQPSEDLADMFKKDEQIVLKCHFPGIVGEQETLGTVKDIQMMKEEIAVRIQFPDVLWWVPPYE